MHVNVHGWCLSIRNTRWSKKRNKKMCKREVEKKLKYKWSKMHMVIKTGKKKGRRNFRTSESREHSKNQEIKILRSYNKWSEKSKWAHWRIKTEVRDSKWEIEILRSRNQVGKEEIRTMKTFWSLFHVSTNIWDRSMVIHKNERKWKWKKLREYKERL